MSTANFFLILSAIYFAPHLNKKQSTFLGISFCAVAMIAKFTEA